MASERPSHGSIVFGNKIPRGSQFTIEAKAALKEVNVGPTLDRLRDKYEDEPEFHELNAQLVKKLLDSSFTMVTLDDYQRMGGTSIKWGNEKSAALARALLKRNYHHLKALDFSGSGMGPDPMAAFAKAVEQGHLINLEILDLRWNNLGEQGMKALSRALQSGKLEKLEILDLFHTRIKVAGMVALGEALSSGHVKNLKGLILGHHSHEQEIHETGDMGGAEALAKALESGNMSNLSNLALWGFGQEALKVIMRGLEGGRLQSLKHLDVGFNSLEDDGIDAIVKAPKTGRSFALKTLDLSWNESLKDKGIVALAKIFRKCHMTSLESLNLRRCSVGGMGFLEIVTVLEAGHQLPHLKTLDLTENGEVNLTTAEAMANAYQNNTFLTVSILLDWPPRSPLAQNAEKLRERNIRIAERMLVLQDSSEPGSHGKVFLCGFPEVGKTTLRRSLERSKMQSLFQSERKHREEKRTRGIEIPHIEFKGWHEGSKLELAVWDLAGQSEYHLLHSAFLPDLAIAEGQATFFVIVVSANASGSVSIAAAEQHLHYWMKFISSSSVKGVDKLKRHVLVVLNNFKGENCHDPEEWTMMLEEYSKKFEGFLNVHRTPLILDCRKRGDVKIIKGQIKAKARVLLKDKEMPRICHLIQKKKEEWIKKNTNYPVVRWEQFAPRVLGSALEEDKLRAATEYLHEAGYLIYFREGSLKEGGLPDTSLVILNPEWFCQKVAGHLLLPEGMLDKKEVSLKRRMGTDGSILITDLKRHFNNLLSTSTEVQEVIAMLLRLGLCYRAGEDKILIPAIIQKEELPELWVIRDSHMDQWVMGFSLALKDNETTLLPIALFRKIQVELAHDSESRVRSDSQYVVGKFYLAFKASGMAVLVEFSADDRVDILVRPLVNRKNDKVPYRVRREQEVNLAQVLLEKVLDISQGFCPGVEFVKKVIEPWSAAIGILPMDQRNVELLVDDVKERVRRGGVDLETGWTVGNELVLFDQLLSRVELQDLQIHEAQKVEMMEEISNALGFSEVIKQGSGDPEEATPVLRNEFGEALLEIDDVLQQKVAKLIVHGVQQHMDKRFDRIDQRLEDLMSAMQEIRHSLQKSISRQKEIVQSIQSLEQFTIAEKHNSFPRFMYLTDDKDQTRWMKITNALKVCSRLHLLCEAKYGDGQFHEVEKQEGMEIVSLKESVAKIAPCVEFTLKVAFVVCKAAAAYVLPGVGLLFPNMTQLNKGAQLGNAAAEFTKWRLTHVGAATKSHYRATNLKKHDGIDAKNEREVSNMARAALHEVLGELTPIKFTKTFNLRRVVLLDSSGSARHVVWICNDCFDKYGDRAAEI